ncbi:MAG: carbon starvation protein A [Deltaproteobacteria bacterium]|jgi:carbon starvation protein|nr:carbon starvation protein A [Deltaproteobacteria bacterium]MBW2536714.1 carbon starvation protein A [Deltaproteobacteria bacterium]
MIALILLFGIVAFAIAYRTYGRWLERAFDVDPERETPAHAQYDGLDYVPAKKPVLLGHHFSSIAGAGPIVGPVIATLVFGWVPTVIWIVAGSIFVGAVHDFSSLVISIKHKARSVAEVAREHMSPLAYRLFLGFVWFALVYVLIVFIDLTAVTFAPRGVLPGSAAEATGGGVATSSLLFVALAILTGLGLYRLKLALWKVSLLFVPLVFAAIFLGQALPIPASALPAIAGSGTTTWVLLLCGYAFVASITPVWILLQPRDYLSSFLLYACLLGGGVGILFGGLSGAPDLSVSYPAYLGLHSDKLGWLFPALFITVACGACSGFHSLVASGTTAKQLDRTSDARLVGYGSMLIEGVLALVAVATVAILASGAAETKLPPTNVFAAGIARFLGLLGLPARYGEAFGLLALSTFLLTTLDTGTRLARYAFEEMFGMKGMRGHLIATVATLALPLWLLLTPFHDAAGKPIAAWKVIWPVFGTTNQLLAALVLLLVSVWLYRTRRPYGFALAPMGFIAAATFVSLVQLIGKHGLTLVGVLSALLLIMAVFIVVEAIRAFRRGPAAASSAPA